MDKTTPPAATAIPDYITPAQIARRLPPNRGTKAVHPSTVVQYMIRGVVLRDGSRLKLKAVRLPGGWRSTWRWVAEFFQALTIDRLGMKAPDQPPTLPAAEPHGDIEQASPGLAGLNCETTAC